MIRTRLVLQWAVVMIASLAVSPAMGQGGWDEADANSDGRVDAQELQDYVAGKMEGFDQFDKLMKALDADKNGSLSEAEFGRRMQAIQSLVNDNQQQEEQAEKPMTARERQRERARRRAQGGQPNPSERRGQRRRRGSRPSLKVGQMAPTFKLKSLDGESETDLSEFRGKRPVVLIFGSYT